VRAGKYLLVFEIVDPEARDRYFPAEGQGSDEIGRFDEQYRQAVDAWKRLHALRADSDIATDYVVVAEQRRGASDGRTSCSVCCRNRCEDQRTLMREVAVPRGSRNFQSIRHLHHWWCHCIHQDERQQAMFREYGRCRVVPWLHRGITMPLCTLIT
jgi:hypothetical protein